MADEEARMDDYWPDPSNEDIEGFEDDVTLDARGWISAERAAEYARVGLPMIRKAFRDRQLMHVRVGRKDGPVRTRAAWVDAWMMRWVVEPTAE